MTEELKNLRDELAERQAEKAFGEYSELEEEECNAYLGIVTDFRLGFDIAVEAMQKEITKLKEQLALRELECKERDNYVFSLESERDKYKAALDKIQDFNTLDGNKYLSYEQGWFGVAEFARQALKEQA